MNEHVNPLVSTLLRACELLIKENDDLKAENEYLKRMTKSPVAGIESVIDAIFKSNGGYA